MVSASRAGQYVEQLQGYKAFIPNPLPRLPEIIMDQEMWNLLSQADRALGRLDGSTDALPNPDLFVFMYVRKEAVLSSQIEGLLGTVGIGKGGLNFFCVVFTKLLRKPLRLPAR